jgi:hypothetical protein
LIGDLLKWSWNREKILDVLRWLYGKCIREDKMGGVINILNL